MPSRVNVDRETAPAAVALALRAGYTQQTNNVPRGARTLQSLINKRLVFVFKK